MRRGGGAGNCAVRSRASTCASTFRIRPAGDVARQSEGGRMAVRAESKANAVWSGNLAEGQGRVRLDSGAAPEMAVSWTARTNREGQASTSPEELIAAAHAACFCMALSNGLNQKGHPPRQ